ncbi:MAG: hypothetical protein GWN58_33110 [Anaerolineae bacterium]|nr:hypothetical protein [Thermoplasmata archaeon]NIV34115.1 hypothetical protein [Anaerolineae bacterium]NIY05966.1 hypothetical protein [Thermoplasmata archaeon]
MTYLVHLRMWHKATNRNVQMRFIVPANNGPSLVVNEAELVKDIEQQYDLSGMDIYEVRSERMDKPIHVPPMIDLISIPEPKG